MNRKSVALGAAVLAVLALPALAQLSLTTTFTTNNGQAGNMFNIIALNSVRLQSFDVNIDSGTWNLAVYAVTGGGTHVGLQTTPSAWTQIASLTGVVSNGANVATPLNLSLNYLIPSGVTQGFYVTVTNGSAINYANGTTLGAIAAQDANIQITQGYGNAYPFGSIFSPRTWSGTVRYAMADGLFAGFAQTPVSGNAPLAVTFTDTSFSSDPGGITAWEWDFQNDGIVDATVPNPTFIYPGPGTFSVRLTVYDTSHPPDSKLKTNVITVQPELLVLLTTPGTGSLFMSGPDNPPGTTEGFLLLSATIPPTVGTGAFFGITFDALVYAILFQPALPCDLFHWLPVPGCWPNASLSFPPGSVVAPPGATFDAVMIQVVGGASLQISNVARISF